MQKRSLIVLVLGIVVALGTAMSLHSRMKNDKGGPGTQVIVAAVTIPAGSFVRADYSLAYANWPKENITDSMMVSPAKPSDFEGAVARRTIEKGEPIVKNLLVKSNEGGFMSAVLEPGKRAVSIAVDSTTGNAGFIFPGDHVDLILTHSVENQGQTERASETFIEDVRVLAVDQMLDNPDNKAVLAKTVTLEVTPKQAESINVAKDLGNISLSLRSLAQHKAADTMNDAAAATTTPAPADLNSLLQQADQEGVDTNPVEPPNLTRDTDVSKIIVAPNAAGSHVRILRGGKPPEDVDFTEKKAGGDAAR